MKNAFTFILNRCKTKTGKAILGVLLCGILLRYPWLIGWLDNDTQSKVFSLAAMVKDWAWGIVIFLFAKDRNETGGTLPLTNEATKRTDT